MTSDDEEINAIIREIQELKISTSRRIDNLERKIFNLKGEGKKLLRNSHPSTAKPRYGSFIVHVDRDGTEIGFGDTVYFLTRGKYDSTEGIVNSSNVDRVFSKDYCGRLIARAPNNLRIKKF